MWCGASARCNGINGKNIKRVSFVKCQPRHRPHVQRQLQNQEYFGGSVCVCATRARSRNNFRTHEFLVSCGNLLCRPFALGWMCVRAFAIQMPLFAAFCVCVCVLMSITLIANVQRQLKLTYTIPKCARARWSRLKNCVKFYDFFFAFFLVDFI